MPFGLRLKKTRRYNVSGKNSFVARIQLLDNAVLEITLTPESLGQDCLDTIAQKLQLEESIYFGLQYSNKNYKLRWVDLEKPLKKQLDKNAHDSMLRLGVMLYTTNIQTLRHEITRYMYFLQLKSDIIEGILPCSEEQAVTLASFALQAEIGNFDPAKHTVEFYQNEYVLLPKNMTTENVSLSELLLRVMNAHQAKVGMSTCQSELGYIDQAAKLQGYGQESFPAKDDSGNELFISASFSGLSVKHLDRQETVHFECVNSLNYGLHNQVSPNSSNPSLTNNEKLRAHLQAALPAYRQSPDYESFIQARLQQRLLTVSEQSQSVGNLGKQNGFGPVESVLYPQPELRQHSHNNHYRQQFRLSYGGMPNNYYTSNNMDYSLESLQHGLLIKTPHGNIVHTISVPELTSEHIQTTEEYITAKLLKNKYKPPPPYPRGSASTPNLARQSNNYLVSSSSPDLVSRRLQAIEAMHEVNLHGSGNVNIDTDLSQSLPIDAFQQLRIQDYHPQVGMYSRHVSQGYQQQYSPQQREFKPALTLNLTDKAQPSDLSMIGVPSGYEDKLPTPPDKARIMSPFQEFAVPLVSPPSEFADHSDIDSNMSPGSVGSPPRHFHLPPQGLGDIYNSQPSLPENHMTYVTGGFGQMNGTGQHGSPTRVYSMPQLHPEMREVNPSHYAMLHVDQANYVNSVQGFHVHPQQQHTSEVETILAERTNHQPQGSPIAVNNHNIGSFASNVNVTPLDNITQEIPQKGHATQSPSPPPALPLSTVDVNTHQPKQPEMKVSSPTSKPSTSTTAQQPSTSKASSAQPISSSKHKSSKAPESPTLPLSPDPEGREILEDVGTENGGYIGPLKLAAMSGLTLLRPRDMPDEPEEESKHPRDARRKILEKQLREGQVFTEYEQIHKKREGAVCYTSKLPENVNRNRFKDVLPYEDCRVELSSSHHNSGGYINASLVKVPIAGEMLHYIAAQSPMENTVQDWWRMVWESGTQVIAMLTKLKEDGREKCFKYWPDCTSPKKNTAEFGPFRVIAQFSNDSGCYITSGLTLRHLPSGEQRTVWHLQYNDWPNKGCPNDVHGFLSFLEEFQSVCRHANSMNEVDVGPPPIVHCSAGVGRTGVLLLVDIMISSLEHNEEINIPKMLGILRQQRMLMVQTVGQYTFVYKALIQSLKNTRLI
nr:tyrosine-protein phosphatase non-receptor type 21-like [Lytechinus pictus]